jgi:hypothetical protein
MSSKGGDRPSGRCRTGRPPPGKFHSAYNKTENFERMPKIPKISKLITLKVDNPGLWIMNFSNVISEEKRIKLTRIKDRKLGLMVQRITFQFVLPEIII